VSSCWEIAREKVSSKESPAGHVSCYRRRGRQSIVGASEMQMMDYTLRCCSGVQVGTDSPTMDCPDLCFENG
jgi:hypothetical protein